MAAVASHTEDGITIKAAGLLQAQTGLSAGEALAVVAAVGAWLGKTGV